MSSVRWLTGYRFVLLPAITQIEAATRHNNMAMQCAPPLRLRKGVALTPGVARLAWGRA